MNDSIKKMGWIFGLSFLTKYFPETLSETFWSSSQNVYKYFEAWFVGFSYGNTDYISKTEESFVRCVS